MKRLPLLAGAVLFALIGPQAPRPAAAQLASGIGITVAPNYRAFGLDEALAANSVSLMLLPVSVRMPLGTAFSFDLYTAYARGAAEVGGETATLSGLVDTQLRGTWAARPWALVTLGLNVPTGNGTHSTEEAQVAALLSTDLLGFREATFGTGAGVTTGVALAHQLGEWGVGYGASYRMTGEFEPSEQGDATYSPGNETVARLAVDRNVGRGGKLTFGGTWQHFSQDETEDNLFQPGARVRGDASYSFRAGTATTMRLFLTDVWRQQGEVSLSSSPGTVAARVGAQNVLILGAAAAMGGALQLRPRGDIRILSHEEGAGSGWIAGAGLGLTRRLAGVDLLPRARLMFGSIESSAGESLGVTGFELELAARF